MSNTARPRVLVASLALSLLGGCGAAPDSSAQVASELTLNLNRAAFFGWNGYADTDLQFSSFFGAAHTVSARFMLQHANGYAGPILAENNPGGTGEFFLGQGEYRQGAYGVHKLVLQVNGVQHTYTASNPRFVGDLVEGTWQHVAVVRTGDTLALYLNGHHLCIDSAPAGVCDFALTPGTVPQGTVRFGRRTQGRHYVYPGAEYTPQHYGFVDDVAVFNRALSATEINALRTTPRLTGTESGLVAGYTFDATTPSGAALPPVLSRPVTFGSYSPGVVPSGVTVVSATRDNALDASFLPLPFQTQALQLPFSASEPWQVIQGWGEAASHNGTAIFCLDLVRAGVSNSTTCGSTERAAATGDIIDTRDNGDQNPDPTANLIDGPNFLKLRFNDREEALYLHVLTGSITSTFPGLLFYPPAFGVTLHVNAGDQVAQAGTRGANNCHLHFDTHSADHNDLVTIPMAFSNYQASDDNGATWYTVTRGVPRNGQWIRR